MMRFRSSWVLLASLAASTIVAVYLLDQIVDLQDAAEDPGDALAQVFTGGLVILMWLAIVVPLLVLLYMNWKRARRP